MQGVGLIFLPVYIPGFLFGILYLVISYLLAKKANSNINHSAHIWGGLFGIIFILLASAAIGDFSIFTYFWESVRTTTWNKLFTF